MSLARSVERTQQCATLHPRAHLNRIDTHRPHGREIDHQPVIRDSKADHAVSAAAHANLEVEISARDPRCLPVRDTAAADDEPWPPVDQRVPNGTRRVVATISLHEDIAIETLRKAFLNHPALSLWLLLRLNVAARTSPP